MISCVFKDGQLVPVNPDVNLDKLLEMEIKFKEVFDKSDDFQSRKTLAELAAMNGIELTLEAQA